MHCSPVSSPRTGALPVADSFESVLIAGVSGLVAGVTSAVLTYYSTKAKIRLDLAAEYDKKLHESYFDWKKLLQPFLDEPEYANEPDKPIDEFDLLPLIHACSELRTSLSEDIGTRKLSFV